jgi:ABC-type polysaccharide/polyol phosphate transport system ATPase subunit
VTAGPTSSSTSPRARGRASFRARRTRRSRDQEPRFIELKKEGLSVLLSEQNIHFAEIVCDRVYVLEKGQIQWTGQMSDLWRAVDIDLTDGG